MECERSMFKLKRRKPIVRFVSQTDRSDCGHACLCMVLDVNGIRTNIYEIKALYPSGGMGLSARQLIEAARQQGVFFKAYRATHPGIKPITAINGPFIAHYSHEHYVVVVGVDADRVHVMDPANGPQELSHSQFLSLWSGVYFSVEKVTSPGSGGRPYGLMEEVLGFLRNHHSAWALMVFVALITGVTAVTIPWLLSKALTLFAYGSGSLIDALMLGFLAMLAMLVFAQWLRSRASVYIQVACDKVLTKRFIAKIMSLPLAVFTSISPGDFISRINALVSVRDFLTSRIGTLLVDAIIILATMIVLAMQSVYIVFAFVGLSLLTCVVLMSLRGRLKVVVAKEVSTYTRYYECTTETLGSAVDIKATGKESAFERRWNKHFDAHQTAIEARGRLGAVIEAVYAYQERVVPIASLLIVALLSSKGSIQDTQMFLAYFLMIWTAPSLRGLQAFAMQLVATSINNERIRSITSLDPQHIPKHAMVMRSDVAEIDTAVELDSVTFSYRGTSSPIIDQLNGTFKATGLKVIMGPSGCGKSTLLRLMAGLLAADKGRVIVSHPELQPDRPVIGYLNQHPTLFAGSITENISVFEDHPDLGRVQACAMQARIHDEIMMLPDRYDSRLADRGGELSSGQRQRIALARLFYSNPHIYLLDEFTSDLDSECEQSIIQNLRNMKSLVIIATHRMGWIREGDFVMDLGKKRESSSSTCPALV